MMRPNIIVVPTSPKTEYVTREVHVHRAPTDESVALLRDMVAKARAEIEVAVHVGDTKFECVVHSMRVPEDGTLMLKAIFSLNGHRMAVQVRDWPDKPDELVAKLRDQIAKKIADEMLGLVLRDLRLPT